jgi:hypothetical protein
MCEGKRCENGEEGDELRTLACRIVKLTGDQVWNEERTITLLCFLEQHCRLARVEE